MSDGSGIFCAGATHRTAPLELRERLSAIPAERIRCWLESERKAGRLVEHVLIATCNRVECYGLARDPTVIQDFVRFLAVEAGLGAEAEESLFRTWTDDAAFVHLFEVAASLDSQLVGETEILGQVKDAYAEAGASGSVGTILHRAFQKAIQSAKWVRSNTAIGRGTVSVGSVAADLAVDIFGELTGVRCLVVGAGEVGEKVARALRGRGLRELVITNRGAAAAAELARELGARHALFEEIDNLLAEADIIMTSTASPHPIFGYERVRSVAGQRSNPLFLIDLAMPRDVDARVSSLADVFLYNLDDLAAIAETNRKAREAELVVCRTEVQRRALAAWESLGSRLRDPKSIAKPEGGADLIPGSDNARPAGMPDSGH
jgi:glutamyl-tRNA reductase